MSGKLVLITGAASGVGYSTAKLFAENQADLILVDNSEKIKGVEEEIKKISNGFKTKVTSHICDITNGSEVDNLFEKIAKDYLKVATVIVNSAGIYQPSRLIGMSEKIFDDTISVNLKGTFLITKSAIKALVNFYPKTEFTNVIEPYASIINISSLSATHGLPNFSHYSASKSALLGFTKSLAYEYGPYRIRVNSVLPFIIDTPMAKELMKKHPENKAMFLSKCLLGWFGQPEEVANLNLFLASDLSSYISGSNIEITGGI